MAKTKLEVTPDATAENTTSETPARGKKIEKKSFSLSDFKLKKGLVSCSKQKKDEWIPASKAFQEITNLPGICKSHCMAVFGYRDTGKSTLMTELAISAQKMGVLPVFIITEQKHRWSHAIAMGMDITETVDEDGIVNHEGFFLHYDRSNFSTIEEMSDLMNDLMDEQEKGNLPHDLLFLIDSLGKINCEMGVKNKNQFNREWIASSVSANFGAGVIPRIGLTNKEDSKFTNTLFTIIQPWTEKANPRQWGSVPKLRPKCGACFEQDSTFLIKFGDDTNAGTTKMKIKFGKQEIIWGTRAKVEVVKNHLTNICSKGRLISTKDGYITENEEKEYLKKNSEYFLSQVGASSLDEVEFVEEIDDNEDE